VRTAGEFGIELDQSSVRPDLARIMRTIRQRRAESAKGVREWVEQSMTPFFGEARFIDDRLIEIDGDRRVRAERVFIASGAKPAIPPLDGLESALYHTNQSLLELDEQPRELLILGGGYIGCEFGHFFASLGTAVTIVDSGDRLLKSEDADVRRVFTEAVGERMSLELGARGVAVRGVGGGVELDIDRSGVVSKLRGDALLIATGRAPNSGSLDLDKTGVETDGDGWVRVDERLRTTNPNIFAYGDCIGRAMFKHTSSYEGELAYRNAMGDSREVDYTANPHAVFAEPEIGSVGLTERECRERGLKCKTAQVGYDGVAKGQILGSPPGLAKAIVEEGSGRILGFHMAGPHSAILIHEIVALMSKGGTAADVRGMIHVHPSIPELVEKVFTRL